MNDTGCEYAPSCLNCPFPVCKYDDKDFYRKYILGTQRDEILKRYYTIRVNTGRSNLEIAKELNISLRLLQKHLAFERTHN